MNEVWICSEAGGWVTWPLKMTLSQGSSIFLDQNVKMSFVPEPTPILNEFLWETKGVALCLVLLLWLIGMASTPASSNFLSKIGHPSSLTGLWLLSKPITILGHEEKNFWHPDFLVVMTVMRTGDGSVDSNLIIDLGKSEDGCILCIIYLLPQTSPKLPWNNKCLLSSLWVGNLGGLSGEVLLPPMLDYPHVWELAGWCLI